MRIALICASIAILVSGCTLFDRQERRIDYTENLDSNGPTLVTDAKQRAIINMKAKVGVGDVKFDASGNATGVTSDLVVKNRPERIICAEPSPDVAQAISAAFTAAAEVAVKQTAAGGATQEGSGSGSLG